MAGVIKEGKLQVEGIASGGGSSSGALTDVELRASPVPVSGPLTDTELRAIAVPVSGNNFDIRDLNFTADKVDVTGSAVAAIGPVTNAELRASAVPVSGPITDTQLRASAVPVSGTFFQATQPVSASSLPLPTGAATETTLGTRLADTTFTGRINTLGQKVSASSTPVVLASDQPSIPVTGPLTDAQLRATPIPVSATDIDVRNLVFATDKVDISGSTLGANSGVDIGDVTVNNASGAAAVNIQDGGNSITVDGPLTDTQIRATPLPISGTVSVNEPVSIDDNGGSITVDNSTISVVGGGTEATAQRVTIANDSTGVLSVDDNGGSLTVDGPITDAQIRASALPVSGPLTDTQLRASAVPVTANAGTNLNTSALGLETTQASIKTAVELIDDTVFVDDAAFTPATSKVLAVGAQADDTSPDSVNEGDIGALRMSLARALHTIQVADVATLTNLASAATSAQALAANANRIGVLIVNDDANDLLLKYGTTASATSYTVRIPGNNGYWEMPVPVYTGRLDAIWIADGAGSARITELT